MSNVMSMKGIRNHVSRNGFDLSRRNLFTAKAGELLPVMVQEVIPGDKFKIKQQWFTRTVPVKTPAYTRIREYYDYFFVPTRLLWRNFDNMVTGTDNPMFAKSLTSNIGSPSSHPFFSSRQVLEYLRAIKPDGTSVSSNTFDLNLLPRWSQSCKLLSYLGYGNYIDYFQKDTSSSLNVNMKLNPFPLLAYQKVYQDFYRNSQWENARPELYNLDYLTDAPLRIDISGLSNSKITDNFFDIRYCDWQKDLFTGILPKSQFGDSSVINLLSSYNNDIDLSYVKFANLVSDPPEDGRSPLSVQISSSKVLGDLQVQNGHSFVSVKSISGKLPSVDLSVLALRQAEALQRRNEITQANRYDYASQTRAHWNVDVPDVRSSVCTYLGGNVGNISIGEVVNTNLSGSDSDANIAGKGVGDGQGDIDFTAKEHGILLCIYHALPLLDWSCVGVRALNLKCESSDYAIPEFDNIGMQQLPLVQLTNSPYAYSSLSDSKTAFMGYAPRYFDYKTALDEVHGAFTTTLKDWTACVTEEYLVSRIFDSSVTGGNGVDYRFFKVNPTVLFYIFGIQFSGRTDDTLAYDQFMINTYFDIKAVRNLDYNGLPY